MRGVILDGELTGAGTDETGGETVHVFLELENGYLHARRGYGTRAAVVTFELAAVEAALAALKAEVARRAPAPLPGQVELELGEAGA